MTTKTVAELIESFRVNGDIVDFTKGTSEIIQARVDALAEATRNEAFAGTGFIKEEKETETNKDETTVKKDDDDDEKEKDDEKTDKDKIEESFKEKMKNQK